MKSEIPKFHHQIIIIFFLCIILENYSFCILLGPPPWEDNTVYKTVNGYHYEALKKFSHLTKEEREEAAKNKIACLDPLDKMPIDEELDKVID